MQVQCSRCPQVVTKHTLMAHGCQHWFVSPERLQVILDQALLQAKTQSSWQALRDQLGKHGVRQLQRLEDCLVKSVELHGHLEQRDTHVIQPM